MTFAVAERAMRIAQTRGDVRFWPNADMSFCTAHVRFRGVKPTCIPQRARHLWEPACPASAGRMKSGGRMRKHHQVREGQIVRVIDGPLTGFRGEVKEVNEQTAKVAVQVFGRVTPMDLALGQIELVPENSN